MKIVRPKNSTELREQLAQNKVCEVVNPYAFEAAKAIEDCGFSFSFKQNTLTKGWTKFEKI